MSGSCVLTILACMACVVVCQVYGGTYENQISAKDRQDILHYAAKILKLALRGDDFGFPSSLQPETKRTSGMLDAVINMPDLYKAGRK
nr:cerebrin [Urechis unicinctus]